MSKFFESSDWVKELAQKEFEKTGLAQMGLDLQVISITKSNCVLSVSKASAITEFRTHGGGDTIHMIVFEDAFSRLTEQQQNILMEGAISNISYDSDKDKVMIDSSKYGELFRMRQKYNTYVDVLEIADSAVAQIAEEEKQRKQEEKEAKAAAKKRN